MQGYVLVILNLMILVVAAVQMKMVNFKHGGLMAMKMVWEKPRVQRLKNVML